MTLLAGDESRPLMYKYRPDNETTLRILRNKEMYFSFVADFNDPFDCRVTVNCKGTERDWTEYANSLPIPQAIKCQTLSYLRSINFDPETILSQYKKQNFQTVVVYCLSEVPDNILMWSHYSNCHRGVCLGFSTEVEGNSLGIRMNDPTLRRIPAIVFGDFVPLTKVSYQSQMPPPYDLFTGSTEALKAFLRTKSPDWAYERERRILLPYQKPGKHIVTFAKQSLSEVILGCRTPREFRMQVLDVISTEYMSAGHAVAVYQADLDDHAYSLRLNRIV